MLYDLASRTVASPFSPHSALRPFEAARAARHALALTVPVLALLVAAPAGAQTAVPQAPTESDPAVIVVHAAPAPAPDPGDPVARVALGLLTGLGMIAVPTVAGYFIGAAAASPCSGGVFGCIGDGLAPIFGTMLGGAVGVTLYPLGVALGAHAVGSRGHVGWTYLGGLIGTTLGGGIIAAGAAIADTMQTSDRLYVTVPAAVLGGAIFLVAPIVAHEMSDHHARTAESPPPALSWMPTLSIDGHGATAGVAGTF